MFEVLEGILDQAFVERAEIGAGVAERIATGEPPEVPVDELPIETVVVAHEQCAALAMLGNPAAEVRHHGFGIVEGKRLFARERADRERLGYPLLGNGPQAAIEGLLLSLPHPPRTETDHTVVARDRPVRFH